MRTVAVQYTLHQPHRNYTLLWNHLRSIGAVHVLDSFWLVRTTSTAKQVYEVAANYIDGNDELLTMDVTGDAWWTNLRDPKVVQWMHGNMGTLRAA